MVDAKASKAFVHAEHESSSLSSCNLIIWYEVLLLAFRAELHSCAYGTVPDSYAMSISYYPLLHVAVDWRSQTASPLSREEKRSQIKAKHMAPLASPNQSKAVRLHREADGFAKSKQSHPLRGEASCFIKFTYIIY